MNAAPNAVIWGFFLSFALAVVVFLTVAVLLRSVGSSFSRIIRDDKGWPSVARWQFALWTIVVLFVFSWIYFIRLLSQVAEPIGELPTNILALMGISTGSAVASAQVSESKKKQDAERHKDEGDIRADLKLMYTDPAPANVKWGTMLLERKEPSLGRIQMFAWTIVAVFIYSWVTVLAVSSPATLSVVDKLTLPDVDVTLLVLMGISQVGYVGSKAVAD